MIKGFGKGAESLAIPYSSDNPLLNEDYIEKLPGSSLSNFSDFFKYLKAADIPQKNYNNITSLIAGGSYNRLSNAERIEKSLNILDRMREENYINKRTHKKLKDKLYYEFKKGLKENPDMPSPFPIDFSFKNYIPLVVSFIFILSGIFLLMPNFTGFTISESFVRPEIHLIGIVFLLFGVSFLGLFLRISNKRKLISKL